MYIHFLRMGPKWKYILRLSHLYLFLEKYIGMPLLILCQYFSDYSRDYCNFNSLKPLSTADFGKVMKQVYPQVRPRRLGTRGNSRYCYAGLKKRLKLEPPTTPECGGENGAHKLVKVNVDYEQEVDEATSFLIREWAGNLFNTKFACVKDLTLYLIDKIYVDNRSSAAHTIFSSMSNAGGMNTTRKTLFVNTKSGK